MDGSDEEAVVSFPIPNLRRLNSWHKFQIEKDQISCIATKPSSLDLGLTKLVRSMPLSMTLLSHRYLTRTRVIEACKNRSSLLTPL